MKKLSYIDYNQELADYFQCPIHEVEEMRKIKFGDEWKNVKN